MESRKESVSIEDLTLELRELSKFMKSNLRARKPRFPYPCKHGSSCAFLACGSCWFVHEGDSIPTMRRPSVERCKSNLCKSIAGEQVQNAKDAFDTKLAASQSLVEKKLGELSNYVDRKLQDIEVKCEALSVATFQNECDIEEIAGRKSSDIRTMDDRAEVKTFSEADIDEKIEEKLDDFMKVKVRAAFEAAFESFAVKFGEKVDEIEEKIRKNEERIAEIVKRDFG